MPMLMSMRGSWRLMFHANAFLTDAQQTSPRGGDKFFSTNWFMPMAQRRLGAGQLTLRAMFSLEPATVSGRRYPLLFQQGETAFGVPIADGQHPHDFFMELGALYDLPLSQRAALLLCPGWRSGAWAHRLSPSRLRIGKSRRRVGHHQQDSTHIADDVVTAGLTYRIARIEASGFQAASPMNFAGTSTRAASIRGRPA